MPRVWEKFHARLLEALEADPKRRDLVMKAIANGREVVEGRVSGKSAPLGKRIKHALFDRLIFSKIRKRLGMEELTLAVTAAAPISRDLLVFFHTLGIPLYEIYGMSENTGPATCTSADNPALGTVGKSFMGVEVKTEEDGEIKIRGGVVTDGYYQLPEATAETFTEDGWLHTGDLGSGTAPATFASWEGKRRSSSPRRERTSPPPCWRPPSPAIRWWVGCAWWATTDPI